MFTIGSIKWSNDSSEALRKYLLFLISVIDRLGISFLENENNPVLLTKDFLSGKCSNENRAKAANFWWGYIDTQNAIQEFEQENILKARLAICFLAITEKDIEQFNENLSWFLEVIGFLGEDQDLVIDMMEKYFS